MFLFARFALVTCAFYLAIAVLLDAAMFGIAVWKGGSDVAASRSAWFVFFGLVWVVSFLLSWRIVLAPLFANIPKPLP